MIVNPRYCDFRPKFLEAMDPAFYTGTYLDSLLLASKAEVWFSENAAIVFEIKDYPGGARVIQGLVAAGNLEEIIDQLIPDAEAYGKAIGCTHSMIESREGWAKALKPHGYIVHQTTVVKGL